MAVTGNAKTGAVSTKVKTAGGGASTSVASTGLSSTQRAAALKIIAAASAYTTRAVMSSPPTISAQSAAFAASSIAGVSNLCNAPMYAPDSPLIRRTGPIQQFIPGNINAGYTGWWTTYSPTLKGDGGDGFGIAFKTNSRYVEICYPAGGLNAEPNLRARVNGQWVSAADFVLYTTADQNPHSRSFDFGTTAARNIEFFFGSNADIFGVNVLPAATFGLPDATPLAPTAMVWGDSFVSPREAIPAGNRSIRQGIFHQLSEAIGVVDMVPNARAGTSYVLKANNQTISERMAVDAPLFTPPQLVLLYGSVNDWNQSSAAVQAGVALAITNLRAAYPDSLIAWFSAFNAVNQPLNAGHNSDCIAGAMANNDPGVLVIDISGLPQIATTGTLPNSATMDSPDGTHPGLNIATYYAAQMKPLLISALKARVGLT